MDEGLREPGASDLQPEVLWIEDTDEICGALYVNEDGEYSSCILHKHPPQTGHCDGVDRCTEYDDPMGDVFRSTGLVDCHGLPTFEFYEHFEAA